MKKLNIRYFSIYHSFVALFVFVICIGCKGLGPKNVTDNPPSSNIFNVNNLTYPLDKKPLVSAHRGGKHIDDYPENCLETFQYISEEYPMIIECDVAQTKDGVLILMHDDAVDRTTDGQGKVINQEWEQLSKLYLKDHRDKKTTYRIPLLKDVLTWAEGKVVLSLDIKRSVDRDKLVEILKKHKAHEYAEIITYNFESAQYYQDNAPKYILSVGIRNDREYDQYTKSSINLKKLKPFVGTRRKDADFYKKLHDAGFLVTLGTLGNIDQQAKARGYKIYDDLLSQGVDIFATDYPLEVMDHFHKN